MDFLTNLVQLLKPNDIAEDSGKPEFLFTNLPQSVGVFVFVGIGVLLLYLTYHFYKREAVQISKTAKAFLIGVRGLVLLLLFLVLLGPAVRYYSTRTIEPSIYMGLDDSLSMTNRDNFREKDPAEEAAKAIGIKVEELREKRPSRGEFLETILTSDPVPVVSPEDAGGEDGEGTRLIDKIGEKGTLKIYGFSDALNKLDKLDSYSPSGQQTDITLPLNEALSDKNTSAVLLFTDGQQTSKSDPRVIARKAKERGIPFYIVGFGDEEKPKNIEVAEVYADPQVWKDDPFEIQVMVRALGLEDDPIELELVEIVGEGDTKTENVIGRRTINLDPGSSQKRTIFAHTVNEPGRREYTVRALQVDGETNPDDNQPPSPASVKILDQKAKVLLISGLPTWGYRSVTQLLTRERSIDLSCWLQSIDDGRAQPGNSPIVKLPDTKDELFKYDVVLLFDPDPIEFDEAWVDLMKDFVSEHAGGCLYQAGPNFTSRFLTGDRTKSMATLLPVELGDVSWVELQTVIGRNVESFDLGVVPSNVDQPMMRFFPEPKDSLELWKSLPGIYWSFPAKEAKPAARVLIEHTDPAANRRPLLVAGQYGSGRIVFQGFNSTWRWRQVGRDAEYFQRFWVQTVRYLIEGRSLEGRRRGVVEAERPRYQLGDRVLMIARLKDASYNPLEAESVSARWTKPSMETVDVELRGITGQPGEFELTLDPKELGVHKFEVTGLDAALSGATIEGTFSVSLPLVETEKIWLNKPLLNDLAELSGGKYLSLAEAGALPELIPDARREDRVPRPPIPLWDCWPVLALLVGLLCIEWIVRKRLKLL